MNARVGAILALLLTLATAAACGGAGSDDANTLSVGAVYPLSGSQADGAGELAGVQLAADLVNADGGIGGRHVRIVSQDAPSATDAPGAVDTLVDQGVRVILGTYGSTQSLAATQRASDRGVTYLETGAVADAITGRGLPGVLRTVATGSTLGRNAARFAHDFVIPHLGMTPAAARIVVMYEFDQYGSSVGYGSIDEASRLGLNIVDTIKYDPAHTDFTQLAAQVDADHPDMILTASYLDDAVAFRRAAIARHLQVKSIIGTSSAYCRVDFGDILGPDAVGLFASDKPDETLNPSGLTPDAQALLRRASEAYRQSHPGQEMEAEVLAGFVGAWAMLHDILPHASSLSQADIWKAAMAVDLPSGSQINGAGIKFSSSGAADAGQNLRAPGVIWEWVGVRHRAVVSPPAYAQTAPQLLPIVQ